MDAISNVGQWFSKNAGTVVPGALAGGGFLSNWLANRRNQQRQNFLTNLAENPAAMSKYVAGFQKPLAAGLTQNVGNQVQGYLGERGLSGTPGVSADVLTQALAPFQQQEQQQAIQEAMGALGNVPGKFGSVPGSSTSNLSGILAMLMKGLKPGASSPVASIPGNQDTGLTFPSGGGSGGPFDLDSLMGGFANG